MCWQAARNGFRTARARSDALSPDGRWLAVATRGGSVLVVDIARLRGGAESIAASLELLSGPGGPALRGAVLIHLTFSPAGQLVKTETAAQAGNDGLVIMPDGVKYVSSVINGGVSRIRPNQPAELIASNIPNAASMCYDAGGKQLVIPMNPNNGLAFVPLK